MIDKRQLYALLGGINRYASPEVPGLESCANAIEALEGLLRDKYKAPTEKIKKLTDGQATHQVTSDALKVDLIAQA